MKIPVAFVADEANLSQDGKLNVLGIFDRIAAASFPTVHPKMVFVFRVHAEFADAGRSFAVRVRLMDEDGGAIFEANGEIVGPTVNPGEFSTANQVFTLVGVQFSQPGPYKFVVTADDVELHETPFMVVKLTEPA
ncbi:MAG TPA: hypothetical protein VHG28_06610 [Longimicrobiaceae bacterium]|nr:hypothetical protein [Longimicrobiaceae bacterium]